MDMAWWPDEVELFDSALSMLMDWDGAGSSPSSESSRASCEATTDETDDSSGGQPTGAAHRSRKAVKINRSRERQKQESQKLRDEVAALERERARLRSRRAKNHRPENGDTPLSASDAMLAVCENMARRQFNARKQAEAVNAKLRELLASHAAVAQDLISVLQRTQQLSMEFPLPAPGNPVSLQCDPSTNEELLRRLDKISNQWTVPYAHCSKFTGSRRELSFFDCSVIRDDVFGSVLDFQVSTAHPFPARSMGNEVWQFFVSFQCEQDAFSICTSSRTHENSMIGEVRATALEDGVLGIFEARYMNRRFRNEKGELVITSAMCGRPSLSYQESGKPIPVNALIYEDAWLRIVDAYEGQTKGESPLTLVQHVRRSRIQFCDAERPHHAHVEALKKFVRRLAECEVRSGEEITERRILLGPVWQN